MPSFTFTPSYTSGGKFEFAVRKINFGDGYTQRSKASINNKPLVFNLVFSRRSPTELSQIDAFLTAMGGVTAFDWLPPKPHDYANAVAYSGSHSKGEVVNDGSGNIFVSTEDSNSDPLTASSWTFLTRVPLKFICPLGSWSYDQHNSSTMNATFEQVFDL